jgi:glycosyltransferase involved in cell wall biosynthesis
MPKVSVIIPTYKRTTFLLSAIESVLRQTYQNFEIIVVDDASGVDVQAIVNSCQDGRILMMRHEVNKGEAEGRNTGILNSRGEYIAFLDDDDEWLPNKLALQVAILENSLQKVGGIYTGYFAINFYEQRVLFVKIPSKRGDLYGDLILSNVIGTPSTVIIRRACIEKVGLFDNSVHYGVDCDFYLRVARHFHFDYLEEPLVKYHVHDERMTNNPEIVLKGLEAMSRKYAKERGFLFNRTITSSRLLSVGILFLSTGNVKKAKLVFLKSILLNPFEWKSYYSLVISILSGRNADKLKKLKNWLFSAQKRIWNLQKR